MRRTRGARILAGVLSLAVVSALAAPSAAPAPASADIAPSAEVVDGGVVGGGPWLAMFGCAGCVAGVIAIGGTTVVGVAALLASHMVTAGLCAGVCTVAFG